MKELIKSEKTMSSLEIAELTGKLHKHVLRDIRETLEAANIDAPKFGLVISSGLNAGKISHYELPRRECDLVVSGYSVPYRLAIIDRWQELESNQPKIPQTYPEALRLAADIQEKLDASEAANKLNAPKVAFAEAVRNMDGLMSVGDFAKIIGTGQNRLFEQLRLDGFVTAGNKPYQASENRGLLHLIEGSHYEDSKGKLHPTTKTMITGKGQVYFERLYRGKKWDKEPSVAKQVLRRA